MAITYNLKVVPHTAGSVEWRVEIPVFAPERLIYDFLSAVCVLVVRRQATWRAGKPWQLGPPPCDDGASRGWPCKALLP